jgi:NADH:ubiquinone oxidoreductase subunit 6 (subunit J)
MGQLLVKNWHIALPVLAGIAAIYLLLPRPKPYPRIWGAAAAAAALLLSGWLLVHATQSRAETVLFYAFSGIAIVAGGVLVTQRNPAYAALSFALVVLSTCGLFLIQAAPFLMAATVIIYAGAVIVMFLFVLMLAQTEGPADANDRSREPLLATVAGFVLLGTLLYVLGVSYDPASPLGIAGDVHQVDQLLARARQAVKAEPRPQKADTAAVVVGSAANPGAGLFVALEIVVASRQQMTQDIVRAAGGDGQFMEKVAAQLRGSPEDTLNEIRANWEEGERSGGPEGVALMKKALVQLDEEATRVRDSLWARTGGLHPRRGDRLSEFSGPSPASDGVRDARGSAPLPAENVASLGRSLFTDYLLAVELGGTLLLVATVGAIAIASRQGGRTP